jgi:hypothetical protein
MSANQFIPSLMLMTLCVGLIVGIWQLLAFLQRREDRRAAERTLLGTAHPVDRGVTSGALPDLAAVGCISIVAMALLFVGYTTKSHVAAEQTDTVAQHQTAGEAADPTPSRPRANPAEKSNPPTSASSPAQPSSTPTTQTGVGTTVDKPAGATEQKR